MRRIRIGTSRKGNAINAYMPSGTGCTTLVLAGMHGDEPKSVHLARKLVEQITDRGIADRVAMIPVVNPDGYSLRQRRNGAGVDINRNFPTSDWTTGPRRRRYYPGPHPASEPETRAVIALIESLQPGCIISIHSISRHRFCNNYDGPAKTHARAMARRNGYPIRTTMGYPTPGSFGTWAGVERHIPTITLELPSHRSPRQCWIENQTALLLACGADAAVD